MKTQTRPRLHTLLAGLLLSLVTTLPARAAESVPPLINYQGSLTDANGAPMAGVKTMEFNLFDAPTEGNLIWGPQIYATVPLIGGKFNVLLGATDSAGRPITAAFADKTRYLSITLEGKEILPRQQILSTPFAMQANNGIPVGTVIAYSGYNLPDGFLLCDGAKISTDPIYNNLRGLIGANTPDLRARFILGEGISAYPPMNYFMNLKGGEERHTLTIDEMPRHTHQLPTWNGQGGTHEIGVGGHGLDWAPYEEAGYMGGNQSHNNMPPFYVLRYLIKY